MNGGVYICDNCGYSIGHFSSQKDNRLACINCDGWMHPTADDMSADRTYKKPNIFWRFIGRVLQPMFDWIDKHDRSDEDDE